MVIGEGLLDFQKVFRPLKVQKKNSKTHKKYLNPAESQEELRVSFKALQ